MTLLKDTVKQYGTSVMLIPAGLALTIVSTRMLGPELRGLLTAAFIVPNLFAQLFNFGLPTAASYYIAKLGHPPRLVGSTVFWSGAALGIAMAAVLLLASWLTPLVFGPDIHLADPDIPLYQQALVLMILPLSLPSTYVSNFYLQRRWYGRRFVLSLLSPLLRIAAIVITMLLLLDATEIFHESPDVRADAASGALTPLVLTVSIATLAMTLLSGWMLRDWVSGSPSPKLAKDMIRFGSWSTITVGSMYLIHYGDQVLLSRMRDDGKELLGIYTLAYAIFMQVMLTVRSVSTTYFFRALETGDTDSDADIAVLSRRGILAMVVVGAVLILLAEPMVLAMSGVEYASAALPMQILALAGPAYLVSELTSNATYARGKNRLTAMPALVGMIVNVALNVLLIPDYGMVGCAWATTAAFYVMALHRLWLFGRFAGWQRVRAIVAFGPDDVKFFWVSGVRIVRGVWLRTFGR